MTNLSIKSENRMIRDNIIEAKNNICRACARAGRSDEATLIAVSKTKPVSMIMEAYTAGVRDFGENKVQELMDKIPQMPKDIRWHMIGHLQTNKVKYIVGQVALIHSVDSLKLAEEINKVSLRKNVITDILLEVNISGEESKWGLHPKEVLPLVEILSGLEGIRIKGLMTVAPFTSNPEDSRIVFRKLKELSVDIAGKNIDNVSMNILSMGMSGDYEVAAEEGATHLRVGSNIFGEREYH